MFYKQFSTIIDILNPEFVENFDYWLATLPRNNQKNITASAVSSRLGVKYSLAESILKFAEKQNILEKYYLVKCPDCDFTIDTITKEELADILVNPVYCDECEEEKLILLDDVYTVYKVILQPDVTEDEIARAIEKKLNQIESTEVNFSQADSLSNDILNLYEAFYDPSESVYDKFKELRTKLDLDYGKNTTAKGKALESLILEIFNQIKNVIGTNDVKTKTNQFDCTLLCRVKTVYPSVFNYLAPYFIIECKNEPEKKPNNTYTNKLESIMHTNDAQFGIVFGRKDATSTCFTISREHYLTKKYSPQQQIIVTCCDDDLDYIIDKRVNLLQYIEYKIFQITSNSPTATFEMFCKKTSE
ncbi:MAG: hypothetical protein K2I03_08455 [Lachnospiraceae bacterium]|nr:hypothetical protein [Lachnospiraceae bacterium]